MSDLTSKAAEKARYESYAALALNLTDPLGPDGALSVPVELRTPYLVYEAHIRRFARPGKKVLDVCCGSGVHSLTAAHCGATVTVSDIVDGNIALARKRAARAGLELEGVVADSEDLPFEDAAFDLMTCAGSLSYMDPEIFFREVQRLLKPGGVFVGIDSLNHNPVYRLNRYIQYLRSRRSKGTILHMPRRSTIDRLGEVLGGKVSSSYHGIFSFVSPFMRLLMGPTHAARVLDNLDTRLPVLRQQAFKIVFVVEKRASDASPSSRAV